MKVNIGNTPYLYPIPIVLVGAQVNGKANYVTVGDTGLMGIKPALVYISLNHNHFTTEGVFQTNTFSINIPTTAMLEKVDYCGVVSGRDVDKGCLFTNFYGETNSAPMIEECPVNLECRVIKEFAIQHRQVFIGEVVQTYVDDVMLQGEQSKKDVADMTKLKPILYALDNHYYSIGEIIGEGYQQAGKTISK
ncbi:MAG TPA: flavin reductase family protein [Longilinea sp.]|nr:flavin reductase family protein [Longilinea sp.]